MMGGITTKLRSAADDAIDEIVSLCDSLRDASRECGKLRSEVDRLNAELAKLQAERDELKAKLVDAMTGEMDAARSRDKLHEEREPRDNGDGTVTAMLPVTYPAGLDAIAIRVPMPGESFREIDGSPCVTKDDVVRLILRHAPKPPEPVTWEAPLADGEWIAGEAFADGIPAYCVWYESVRGLSRPAKLGTYQFRDGVGTLIEAAQ